MGGKAVTTNAPPFSNGDDPRMRTISPTQAQVDAMTAGPADTPFVMVNLLKFKTITETGEPGKAAYRRYAQNTAPHLSKAGGRS